MSKDTPFTSVRIEELRRRTSMKWRMHGDDVLPLWVAEMDVELASPVVDAVTTAMRRGDTGYPAGNRYAEAFAGFAAERWGWTDLSVDRTAIVPDVMMGIVEVLRLVTDPDDAVVVTPPVYPPFYAFVSNSGRRVLEAPLGSEGRLDLDRVADVFREAATAHRRVAFLLSNPHNPTGTVHTLDELRALARLARDHGVRVISDEIHAPLVFEGEGFTPYLTVSGAEDAFTVTSASKAWNLAGLKAAIAVAGADAADDLARLPEEVGHGPSHVGIIAHEAAYLHGVPWLDSLLRGLEDNRALLSSLLPEHLPDVGWNPPQGTYLAWLDCRSLGLDEGDDTAVPGAVSDLAGPARFFLDHARVALSSGHVFGPGGQGHVRLNFATAPDILTDALVRMGEAVRAR
ncbi:aminotransferase class I/II-fold pyridoxal phosphate-dependent enzyme [Nocardiopsis sp. ATB16-24]|uniref:MalY/PatB family protein n=1 Tax=Nocardiopsis sp. ATB16-24 TaxID=3019555 RepID=UPI002556D0D1|nr:aminotransferase class I/II-fold pyridoxal phosphate-dependent enzyme [Nocardiopsis sp. ATB16-24]